MIIKIDSLRKKRDFDKLYKEGKALFGSFLNIRCRINNYQKIRLGIVVSLKISKKAVERNYLRRIIKEITKEFISSHSVNNYDLIVSVKKTPPELDKFKEIKKDLEQCLKKLF